MKKEKSKFLNKALNCLITLFMVFNSLGFSWMGNEAEAATSDILDNSQSIGMKFTGKYNDHNAYSDAGYHIKKLKKSGLYALCIRPDLITIDGATYVKEGSAPSLNVKVDNIANLSTEEKNILKNYQSKGGNLANLLASLAYEIKQNNPEAYMSAQLFIWEAMSGFSINTVTYIQGGGNALPAVRKKQTEIAKRAVAYITGPVIAQDEIDSLLATANGNTITLTKDVFNYFTVSGNGASISGNKLTIDLTKVTTGQFKFTWDTNKIIDGEFARWNPDKDANGSDVSQTQPIVSFGAKPIEFPTTLKFQKTFSVLGTTVATQETYVNKKLYDEVTVSVEGGKEWPKIAGTQTPVSAKFEIEWYFSKKNYENQKIDVNSLPNDVEKLSKVDSFTVSAPGTVTIQSQNIPTKQGFYYPVLKLDKSKQATQSAFEKGFQAKFNEANERSRVIEQFAVEGTTQSKIRVQEGEELVDVVNITSVKGNWPDIIETTEKVPVKFQLDWYYSENDYGSTKYDVNNIPSDAKFIGSDTHTVTKIGQYTITSKHKSTGPGFYYPVLKVVVADQAAYQEYFLNGFQAPFNDTNEQTITKWKPKVKTETTVTQMSPEGGEVADRLTVSDNKDKHQLVVKSTLYGPFLTKPDFIKSPNQHDGGSTIVPANSPIAGKVSTTINGNGTFTTPKVTITEKGWYVWVEEIESTNYTEEWHSDFGSEDEYVVVPWILNIETTVSDASAEIGAQVYDSITVLDLPGLWGLPADGLGDLDKWGQKNPELVGKDRDPDKDGNYNLPKDFGKGEDKALEATFTMYYSPTKPIRGSVPANAEVYDVVKAPLIQGVLKTTEFKEFEKAGWYTIVVSGGSDEGRLAKFETEYGIPSETVFVPHGEEEFYTQVNVENTFVNRPVYDTLHVNKSLKSDDAEVTFTLYKYSDKVNDFDYSDPKEIAKSDKGMAVKKFGEYKSNAKGYGLEDLRISEPGTYGWIAEVVDTKTKKMIYKGEHGDVGEVFNVDKVTIHTKASSNDIYLGEPIHDTVILENTVPDGYYVIVDLYKFSGKVNDFANAEDATKDDIVWTSKKIKVSASGEYKTDSYTPTEVGSYGYVEKLYDENDNLIHTGKKGEETENVVVRPKIEIGTSAKDSETDFNEGNAAVENGQPKEEIKIIDTVTYKDLVIGRKYTVKGTLMDKSTGKAFVDSSGNQITAEKTFTADKENGTIDLAFIVKKTDMRGKTVVVFEKLYEDEKEVAVHEEIDDEDQTVNYPDIGTKAAETSIHGDTVILKDIVSYDNLIPGKEYKVTGTLMDKATGEAFKVDDKEITGEATFTANKKGSGTVEVEFTFARKALEDPKNLVVFEKLYNVEGKLVGLHEDIEDKDQTVEVKPEVEVKTDAIDKDTEMNEGLANERVTIVDRVSYKHLIVGKNYTVKGTLMDKATGKPFLTREGDEVHAEKTFKAEQSDGTINLEFYIKRGDLAGKTVVVFEKLYHDEKEVAVHTDIEDEAQTVTYPKVGTKASETTGSTDKEVIIKDIVSYENLVPGKEYTVTGTLMDKATGKPFKAGDDEVTGKATFVAAESGSGTVEVTFQFDRSHLTEETVLVVFEKLFNAEGKLVGLHEDIEDEDQTVRQPQVSTKAKDKETGTNEGFADEDVTVVDEVSYKNLEIGKEYTVKGILMDKATNKPFVTRDGNEVHAEKTFTATKRDGTIELEFKITKGDLAGKTVVVFETLYQEEKEVAAHTDIEDKDQSVHYPKVGTQAAEVSSDSDEDVMIKDIVFYENLIPGESYTVRGKLMMKDANAPFTVMGREVESQATFVASDSGSGTVEMTFTFRRSLLSNDLTLVVFEKLFDAKGNLIGAHEDINDEAQTVTIKKTNPELPKTKGDTFNNDGIGTSYGGGNYDSSYSSGGGGSLPQTGERVLRILPYLGLVIVILAGALYFYRKRQV